MIVGFIQNLLGRSSTGVLPGKQDIADSCPVAVDTQKSEGEGNLGNPGAPSLNQEVDKHQTEGSEQGENCPVFRTGKTETPSFSLNVELEIHLQHILYLFKCFLYITLKGQYGRILVENTEILNQLSKKCE